MVIVVVIIISVMLMAVVVDVLVFVCGVLDSNLEEIRKET